MEADAYFPITSPACAALESATVRQIRDQLVAEGIATDEDIDRHLANVAAGGMDLATAPMISAWGRRAPEESRVDIASVTEEPMSPDSGEPMLPETGEPMSPDTREPASPQPPES